MAKQFIGCVVGETYKAWLFQDWFWPAPLWVPKSQAEKIEGDYEIGIKLSAWFGPKFEAEETECKEDRPQWMNSVFKDAS